MRVTENMIYQSTLANTETARENIAQAQSEVSTGIRVQHPGDDPVAASLSVEHTVDGARYTAIGQDAQRAADELSTADTALSSVSTATNQALVLATQFGNDTYDAADRANAAVEVDGISQQIITSLNSEYDGRYIFAGTKDNNPPFDSNGNYLGDDGVRSVEIAPGLYQASSVDANTIIKGGTNGVDLLKTLSDLSTALKNNDGDTIRAQIGNLNTAISQLASGRTQIGMALDAFQAAVTTSQSAASNETVAVGKLLDADVLDASTKLSSAQYALDATLTAAAKTMSLSLVNMLPAT